MSGNSINVMLIGPSQSGKTAIRVGFEALYWKEYQKLVRRDEYKLLDPPGNEFDKITPTRVTGKTVYLPRDTSNYPPITFFDSPGDLAVLLSSESPELSDEIKSLSHFEGWFRSTYYKCDVLIVTMRNPQNTPSPPQFSYIQLMNYLNSLEQQREEPRSGIIDIYLTITASEFDLKERQGRFSGIDEIIEYYYHDHNQMDNIKAYLEENISPEIYNYKVVMTSAVGYIGGEDVNVNKENDKLKLPIAWKPELQTLFEPILNKDNNK